VWCGVRGYERLCVMDNTMISTGTSKKSVRGRDDARNGGEKNTDKETSPSSQGRAMQARREGEGVCERG